jgi:hypothetical protein
MDRYRFPEYPIPPRFPWGIPEPFWLRHRDLIGRFVKEHELKPVPGEYFRVEVARPVDVPEPRWPPFPWPIPFPGGLRIPHLHFKGELFELDQAQWQAFTRPLVVDLRARLERAETVGFGDLVELADVVDGLPG